MPSTSQTDPIVTVVCPIFNDLEVWHESIRSVLSQELRNFELWIIENGSTDRTREALTRYTDPRIRVMTSHINLKSELMAKVLPTVRTKYLSQIYSDDVFEPNKLRISIKELESSGADACFSNNSFINDDGEYLPDAEVPYSQFTRDVSKMSVNEHLYRFFTYGNSLHPVAMVVRSDAFREVGGVHPYLHSIGDMLLFTKLLLHKEVAFLPEKLQRIRINSRPSRVNESAPSNFSYLRVMGERPRFFELLNSETFLERIDKVFYPDLKGVSLRPEMRRWFLATKLMNLGDPDAKFYGIQVAYQALDENIDHIEASLIESQGLTVAQFIEQMTTKIFVGGLDTANHHELLRVNNLLDQHKTLYSRAVEDFQAQRDIASRLRQELRDAQHALAVASYASDPARGVVEPLELGALPLGEGQPTTEVINDFADLMIGEGAYFDRRWYLGESRRLGDDEALSSPNPLDHYVRIGAKAGRNPNQWFDERWYLTRVPEARRMVSTGQLASGLHHYLRYGYALSHDPSPRFSESAYLNANPDVAAAVAAATDGLRSGFEHWLAHGMSEGRGPLGEPRRDLQAIHAAE